MLCISNALADVILVTHAVLVVFNVGALPIIWLGHFKGWSFVRNFCFRMIHLVLIAVVAGESILGITCPLTVWENALRPSEAHEDGFIAYWLQRLLYYDLPAWVFIASYVFFFLLVAITFFVVRPDWPSSETRRESAQGRSD